MISPLPVRRGTGPHAAGRVRRGWRSGLHGAGVAGGQPMPLRHPSRAPAPPPGAATTSSPRPSCSQGPALPLCGRTPCRKTRRRRGAPTTPTTTTTTAPAAFAGGVPTTETAAAAAAFARAFLAVPAQRDTAAAVLAAVLAMTLVKACDVAATRDWLDRKLTRKLVHTLAGPGFVLCWPLFSAAPTARYYAAAVPAANLLRLVAVGAGALRDEGTVKSMSREGDRKELLRGPTFYVLALIATTLLAWRTSPVSALVVALMCGGDGLADIVGRRWGGATGRLPWNAAKSWAGSAAMFVGGSAMAAAITALFTACGFFSIAPPSAAASAIATTALVATVAESLPLNRWVDDNVSVPALAALVGWWLLRPV